MKIDSIKFKGHRCFQNDWAGFDRFMPINVIIGRNNSGKSHLLDLVRFSCDQDWRNNRWRFQCAGILDEESLKWTFQPNSSGGPLGQNHWEHHGTRFVDVTTTWEVRGGQGVNNVTFPDDSDCMTDLMDMREIDRNRITKERMMRIEAVVRTPVYPFHESTYRHLLADRDISPEPLRDSFSLSDSGSGATNIIRRFLLSADPEINRDIIRKDFLSALNEIFGQDGYFTEVQAQLHDHNRAEYKDQWEIYFGEENKGLIALSNSGSGLKTITLVLLNLIAIPVIDKKDKDKYVFAFEELENNLHPALLRRLFAYLENYALENNTKIFLTTHSSVALDFFGVSENAQIIHVTHDGKSAKTRTIAAHFDKLGIVSELGAKPSDLLQANGIIWVEGPSDRVYLNHWIAICSGNELREGRDYQCAFFGGSLLARTEFASPGEQEVEQNRVNLLHVNPNIVLVCDGDRVSEGSHLKERVKRIKAEVEKVPGALIWITAAKEIENYIPGKIIGAVKGKEPLPDPEQYQHFFPSKKPDTFSYLEAQTDIKTLDKTKFALECVQHMTKEDMSSRFDWAREMEKIVNKIRTWNT